jgi:hypothetical protein
MKGKQMSSYLWGVVALAGVCAFAALMTPPQTPRPPLSVAPSAQTTAPAVPREISPSASAAPRILPGEISNAVLLRCYRKYYDKSDPMSKLRADLCYEEESARALEALRGSTQ